MDSKTIKQIKDDARRITLKRHKEAQEAREEAEASARSTDTKKRASKAQEAEVVPAKK